MYVKKSAINRIDYPKENKEDTACRPLALLIYSLDLIASVDFSLSLWFKCPYRLLMPHSTDDLSNTIIISNTDMLFRHHFIEWLSSTFSPNTQTYALILSRK
jgi:hypothetical protein